MNISAQDVNKLRKMTGAGMMDCKKALVEAEGDFDKAIEILRKKGQKISEKRADRETKEGSVFVKTNEEGSFSVMIALGCETDFVAKNEEFQSLGQEILNATYEHKPADVEALREIKVGDMTLGEKVTELVGKIGEKIDVVAYETLEGEQVVPYIHAGNKLGVLVALKGSQGADVSVAGKDVAMQIAAMNPVGVRKEDVGADIVEKELQIGRDQAIAEGKPEHIIDKIAEGKLNKFFKENTLLNQAFVKDNSLSVEKYLGGVAEGLTVDRFKRVAIG